MVSRDCHLPSPSTMNASESVDLARIVSASFWAGELYQACAFSMLSNSMRASRSGALCFFIGAVLSTLLFAAAFVFWNYYPHGLPLPGANSHSPSRWQLLADFASPSSLSLLLILGQPPPRTPIVIPLSRELEVPLHHQTR